MSQTDPSVARGSRGVFLSLEGVDGAGKTTQCRLLVDWLRDEGWPVTACREPGGTPVGDQIRAVLLDRAGVMNELTELFLFMASRAALVDQVIRPALEQGGVVVVDRFVLSSVVYQGLAGGVPADTVWDLGRLATGGLLPDLTLVLDLPADAAQARKVGSADRMEGKGLGFLQRVRDGFVAEARRQPDMVRLIDASQGVDVVQAALRQEVRRVLESRPRA
jgi:dTMP kinase